MGKEAWVPSRAASDLFPLDNLAARLTGNGGEANLDSLGLAADWSVPLGADFALAAGHRPSPGAIGVARVRCQAQYSHARWRDASRRKAVALLPSPEAAGELIEGGHADVLRVRAIGPAFLLQGIENSIQTDAVLCRVHPRHYSMQNPPGVQE